MPGASQRANPLLKRCLMGLNFSSKLPASAPQPRKIDPVPFSGAVMWILGSLGLMGSLEFVGGGAGFYFPGTGSSPGMANGRTEWGRRPPSWPCSPFYCELRIQGMLMKGCDCENQLEEMPAEVCSLASDSWAETEILLLHQRGYPS